MSDNTVITPEGAIQLENTPMKAWEQADYALSNGLGRVLLYGLPGTGKSYYALNYHTNNQETYKLVCTQDMTDSDLIGMYKPTTVNGQMQLMFHEGVAIKAWRTGGRLVVDEIDKVNGDIESRLMSLIDTHTSSVWQNPDTGETIKPHADFTVVATMNGEPEDLGRAIQDRLVVQIEISEPHPDAIEALPKYLRDMAYSMASRTGKDRYSLRNFVEFSKLYERTNDLNRSAQVCLPRIQEQLIDALSLSKVEA